MFGKKKDKEYQVIAVYNDYRHHKTFKTLPEAEVYVKELQEKAKKREWIIDEECDWHINCATISCIAIALV